MPTNPALGARLARLRRRLRRARLSLSARPLAFWLVAAAAAGAVGLAVHSVVRSAEATRHAYGRLRPVVITTRGVTAGELLDASNTEVADVPVALVADGALAVLEPGTVAASALAEGEAVLALRVGRGGVSPVAALVAPGRRALALPMGEVALPLQIGDRLDVVAAVLGGAGGAAGVVAAGASVVHVEPPAVVVSVAADEVPAVAQALADGGVVLALSADP